MEGKCTVDDPYPPVGSTFLEFSVSLMNVRSSIFRKKYDDNAHIGGSPAVLLLIQGIRFVMQPIKTESIRFVAYDDLSEGVEFGAISEN